MEDMVYVNGQIVTHTTAYTYYTQSLNPSHVGSLWSPIRVLLFDNATLTCAHQVLVSFLRKQSF